ncbi:MAG: HU family DNA-binding protein [Muribaculum sp.]|nr:HU family DNA-binding protein [Muribaculum sp.]
MDSKITLNQLAENIANSTGSNSLTAKAFIQEFTDIVTDALSKGHTVTIKGLGTFSISDDLEPAVIWHPDDYLASNVNQPFEAFEPVELEDGVTEEILSQTASTEPTTIESEPDTGPDTPAEELLSQAEQPDLQEQPEQAEQQEQQKEPEQPDSTPISAEIAQPDSYPESPASEVELRPKPSFNPWLMLIAGILGGFIIGYFSAPYLSRFIYPTATVAVIRPNATSVTDSINESSHPTESPITATAETPYSLAKSSTSAESTPTAPAVVTDTITARRFLTTMARKYYGDYRFWVYIYLENSDIISDPNRIKPGTEVVIPPAEKYGIDSADPESIDKANEKIHTIMENLDK